MPKKKTDTTVVVSCAEDAKTCKTARKNGLAIVGAEFILTGILRQQVEIEAFTLE